MWSNFAQQRQPVAPSAQPQQQEKSSETENPPADEQATTSSNNDSNNNNNNLSGDGDAWGDDDDILLEDEMLDDSEVNAANDNANDNYEGGAKDVHNVQGGAFTPNFNLGSTKSSNINDAPGVSSATGGVSGGGLGGGLGAGIGGWGRSALQTFSSPHKPLDLSFGAAAAAAAPPPPSAHQAENNDGGGDGWEDDDNDLNIDSPSEKDAVPTTASAKPFASPLERAAETFGAALLASMDDKGQQSDDDFSQNDDDDDAHQQPTDEQYDEDVDVGGGRIGTGFGGGFVMKGLSRFIEAATAPQEEEEDEGGDDDGWGEDEDFFDDEEGDDNAEDEDLQANEDTIANGGVATEATSSAQGEEDPAAAEVSEDCQITGAAAVLESLPEPEPITSTAVEEVGVDAADGDGWDDEFDISLNTPQKDDGMSSIQTPTKELLDQVEEDPAAAEVSVDRQITGAASVLESLPEPEPIASTAVEEGGVDATDGDGWDDEFDISLNTPQKDDGMSSIQTPAKELLDSGKASSTATDGDVPDSIKDFAAKTESALDSELSNFWKTPPPRAMAPTAILSEEDEIETPFKLDNKFDEPPYNDTVVTKVETDAAVAEAEELTDKDALSNSLTDFVDNLDAELNDFTRDATTFEPVTNKEPVPTTEQRQYIYEENKDESPEPVRSKIAESPPPTLPHQESWYLNAMEDGQGGVVYVEEALKAEQSPPVTPKGELLPGNISLPGSAVKCPSSVGMPLSEMPSSTNLFEGVLGVNGTKQPEGPVKISELQCRCLELIMPIPENGEDEHENGSAKDGFGKKNLPDGTSVLVNYEKLLQNEATKRILLQRSVEAYEHSLETIQEKHQLSWQTTQEQEIQLASAHSKIAELEEMVFRLQDEKENMVNETQLFEAELASAINDKEYLEKEVETLQETFKSKEEAMTSIAADQAEQSRLIDQVEVLQTDLSEFQQESAKLRGEKDLLQQERDQLNGKVEELLLFDAAKSEAALPSAETESLKSTIESLQQELHEKESEIEQLNEERGQLNAQVQELISVTLTTNTLIGEADSLRSSIQAMQQDMLEKDNEIEEMRATLVDQQASIITPTVENDQLRKEYESLQQDFSDTKSMVSRLQDENEYLLLMQQDYNAQISELKATIESMDCDDSGEVDKLAAKVASLTYELGVKTTECEETALVLQELQSKSDAAVAQVHENQSNEREQSLRAENNALVEQVAVLQADLSLMIAAHEELALLKKSLDDKVAECAESTSTLQAVQAKLDDSKAQLAIAQQALEAKTGATNKQLADLQGAHSLLGAQKDDLEKSVQQGVNTIQSLESQIESQNVKLKESANLRGELSRVRKSFEDKVHECETVASSYEELKSELLNTSSDREVVIAKSEQSADESREQISRLQAQVADLLRDHNATMASVEMQLTSSLQENSSLRSQCEEYRVKLEAVQSECSDISHSTSDAVAKYADQVSKLQNENFELSTALQSAQSELETKQLESSRDDAEAKQLQKTINSMQEEMDSIAHRHQELIDKNHSLMQEKSEITQSLEARATAAEQQTNLLQTQCANLRTTFDGSQQVNADAQQAVADMREQMQSLKDANANLEDQLFEASFESPETDRLAQENASLRTERDELKEESRVLSQQVNELVAQADSIAKTDLSTLSNGDFMSIERESLLARIQSLEDELKKENLNDLRDELTSLHEERQHLDLDNEELLVQLGLMQQDKLDHQAEMVIELETMREQVSTLQDKCNNLQNELDTLKNNPPTTGEKGHDDPVLEEANKSLRQIISELTVEKNALEEQINDLTAKTEGLELQNSQTIKTLRQKLGLLELKLADREEEVESTKKEMQTALVSKDKAITKLTSECSSRENDLKEMSNKLDSANNEIGAFSGQLETIQTQFEQVQIDRENDGAEEEKAYEYDDDDDISLQDLLAEAVLDSGDDYLRAQIVVLAQSLERSELQRADALERIFSERKSNSESLRQLGESVKRFYVTVRSD